MVYLICLTGQLMTFPLTTLRALFFSEHLTQYITRCSIFVSYRLVYRYPSTCFLFLFFTNQKLCIYTYLMYLWFELAILNENQPLQKSTCKKQSCSQIIVELLHQIVLFSHLPKKYHKTSILLARILGQKFLFIFWGSIESKIICF